MYRKKIRRYKAPVSQSETTEYISANEIIYVNSHYNNLFFKTLVVFYSCKFSPENKVVICFSKSNRERNFLY